MNNEITVYQGHAVATAGEMVAHALRVQEVIKSVMKESVHYGKIPGTKKNTLYKPGAETLCATFHIAPTFPDSRIIEDRFEDGVRFRVTCVGVHQGSGVVVAEGMGSCSSHEEKYKWCKAYKREWEETPPDRRRIQYGYDREKRTEYQVLQVRVETADIENTLLKMACKRALIAMTLNAVAASDSFSQDIEDLSEKARSIVVDEETGEITQAPKVEPPRSKKANGETPAASEGEEKAPPVKASPNMIAHVKRKAEGLGKTDADVLTQANVASFDELTVTHVNGLLKWFSDQAAAA